MLKNWQFNILFFVGVGGAVFLLVGPALGLNIDQNPTALTGIGAILTYVLTQKKGVWSRSDEKKQKPETQEKEENNGPQ